MKGMTMGAISVIAIIAIIVGTAVVVGGVNKYAHGIQDAAYLIRSGVKLESYVPYPGSNFLALWCNQTICYGLNEKNNDDHKIMVSKVTIDFKNVYWNDHFFPPKSFSPLTFDLGFSTKTDRIGISCTNTGAYCFLVASDYDPTSCDDHFKIISFNNEKGEKTDEWDLQNKLGGNVCDVAPKHGFYCDSNACYFIIHWDPLGPFNDDQLFVKVGIDSNGKFTSAQKVGSDLGCLTLTNIQKSSQIGLGCEESNNGECFTLCVRGGSIYKYSKQTNAINYARSLNNGCSVSVSNDCSYSDPLFCDSTQCYLNNHGVWFDRVGSAPSGSISIPNSDHSIVYPGNCIIENGVTKCYSSQIETGAGSDKLDLIKYDKISGGYFDDFTCESITDNGWNFGFVPVIGGRTSCDIKNKYFAGMYCSADSPGKNGNCVVAIEDKLIKSPKPVS